MGWRWLLILVGICAIGLCFWLCQTTEPFQGGGPTSSYSFEDVSGTPMARDIDINKRGVDAIFDIHLSDINSRITDLSQNITDWNREIDGYRKTDCDPVTKICTDRCTVPGTTQHGPHSAKGARCDEIQYDLVPNSEKLQFSLMGLKDIVADAKQNWFDMLSTGALNFMYDYAANPGSIPNIPVNKRYEWNRKSNFDILTKTDATRDFLSEASSLKAKLKSIITVYSDLYNNTGYAKLVSDNGWGRNKNNEQPFLTTANSRLSTLLSATTTNDIYKAAHDTFNYVSIYTLGFDYIGPKTNRKKYPHNPYGLGPQSDFQLPDNVKLMSPTVTSNVIDAVYEANDMIINLNALYSLIPTSRSTYTRNMPVRGTLTSTNKGELDTYAALVKRIWLAIPNNLDQYIYVNPDTMKAYMRPVNVVAPNTSDMKCQPIYKASDDGLTYSLITAANNFNKSFCTTEITPDLLAMLPVPARTFIPSYIQRRIQRISEITIQSDKDYQKASTAFQKYQTDLSGLSLKLIATGIRNKINGSDSIPAYAGGGSTMNKVYVTRMILEKTYNPPAVSSSDPDYTAATNAYNAYTADLKNNPNLSTTAIEGLVMTYYPKGTVKGVSLLSAMLLVSTTAVNAVTPTDSDYTNAQTSFSKYLKDLQGNVALQLQAATQKIATYVGGESTLAKSYFTIMLQLNDEDMGKIDKKSGDYTNAQKAYTNCKAVPADGPLPIDQKVTKYIPTGSMAAKAIFVILVGSSDAQKLSFDAPPAIQPTLYFTSKKTKIYDQIAQGFYALGNGTRMMAYIYDIFPVGKSILDVRFDLKESVPAAAAVTQMKALTAAYRTQLVQNLSVNQRATLISNYQNDYAAIRDSIADAEGRVTSGATMRFFYTTSGVSGEVLTLNAMAEDQIAAGSFYTQYNCGLDTPLQDSPGKINYTPITQFTKNASDPLDCTDKATLIQIGIDYVDALVAVDISKALLTIPDPWDQNTNLYVTKILGVQQLTPLSCNLQWEETTFDPMSNKPGPAIVRNVYVPYVQNASSWFATEIFFDASGFKYLKTAPAGLTMLNPPMVLPPPYMDNATLDNGGICPKVSCSDPATLYKMIDDYNTIDGNPGFILRVIKAVTMNAGQCDILADIDYSKRPDTTNTKLKGTLRQPVSLFLALNVPTCTYDYLDYEVAYGIQDQTPLMKDASGNVKPFDYLFQFGVNIFTEISKAANTVKDQITSTYEMAKGTLSTYRESTFANLGNMKSFDGCPQIQCHSIDVMSEIFHKYDGSNKFKSRMAGIIEVGTSTTASNSCDVVYNKQDIVGWNDASGLPIYGPMISAAGRFRFITDTGSAYAPIFEEQLAKLRANGGTPAQIQAILDQKAAIEAEVSCSFVADSYLDILPSKPTWAQVRDLSNALPVLNPSKKDLQKFSDMFPYPNPFPPMTVNCKDYKIINMMRQASIETRTAGSASDVIGYTIASAPGALTITDRTATKSGPISMRPTTLVYSTNVDFQTCAVEMEMDGGYRVHRHFQFDITNKLQYTMMNMGSIGTMPRDTTGTRPYKEFRDILTSKVYAGIATTKPFSASEPVHAYTYREAPKLLNLSIVNPLPLVVDPACRLEMRNLTVITAALGYNGYPKPFAVSTFPSTMPGFANKYEVRITDNEYLPFGATYKIVSFYTSDCNPIIDSFEPSNPTLSQLGPRVGNFDDPRNMSALRQYIATQFVSYVSDSRPKRRVGTIWKGGFDPSTNLYIYEVTMGDYDADGNTINFYGYPQNAYDPIVLPRAFLACEFRKRFRNPDITYLANMYVMKTPPEGVTLAFVADPAPTILGDPFKGMMTYRYLEFTPLEVRPVPQRPNQKVQLTRLEFYAGNAIQTVTGSLSGEILTVGAVALQSVTGFADLFKTDGQTLDPSKQACFVSMVGAPIRAYSATAIKVDGVSFMSGRDPAFDIMKWKLRGSLNGTFWKEIYLSPPLTYPAYGFWRVPMMSIQDFSTALPQTPLRPKGFLECGAAVNTIDMVNVLSSFTYGIYSRSYFSDFLEAQKNTSRAYLRDLSDVIVDDFNNTVYIRAKIQTLDATYTLATTSINFMLTFQRSRTCVQPSDYTITTVSDMLGTLRTNYNKIPYTSAVTLVTPPAFTQITVTMKQTDTVPFAYGGYPSALTKYTRSAITLENAPPYTVSSFKSNGPDRPATITVSPVITNYSRMAPEGAAQMCQDNLDCIGFSVNTDGMTGSFVSTPTANTKIVDSAGQGTSAFFVKAGFTLVAYIRFRGMGGKSPVSLSKVAFYKGTTLVPVTLNPGNSYPINAQGVQTTIVAGWTVANLAEYSTTAGWQGTGVDGFMMRFQTPLIFDGYTLVTSSLPTATDPTSWIVETSMNGTEWTRFDTRTNVTPPAARFTPYPIFRPSRDSGVSTDFAAKTLAACNISCASLLPKMTTLYLDQTTGSEGKFFVDAIGYDPTNNQCLLGWDDAKGVANVTGFVFPSVFGTCDNASLQTNITIKRDLTATGLTRLPDTGLFRYIRFKPTALNGGKGTCLAFIGFLSQGTLLEPSNATNVAGTDDAIRGADRVIDGTRSSEWKCSDMGNLIIEFTKASSADSFTMIAGSEVPGAPVSWILESSPNRVVWSVLHEQKTRVTAPAPGSQYQVYSFNGGAPQTAIKGVLDKTIQEAGYTCASNEIINGDATTVLVGVNDAAFERSIFFNPVAYTYDNIRNQCHYKQGSDGSTLTVTFSTTKSADTSRQRSGFITTLTNMVTSTTPLTGAIPFTSGLQGLSDCKPGAQYSCDNPSILDAMSSAATKSYQAPLSATASGYDSSRNECVFELDTMYAPQNTSGASIRQVGFQIKKNMGCTVPGAQALIIDTTVPAGKTLTTPPRPSGPYIFIRFKVTRGALKIGRFEFFKGTESKKYNATISSPLGMVGTQLVVDGLMAFSGTTTPPKPIQFQFNPSLDFDGYSWTTAETAGADPIAWTLQASTNGYIWVDLDTRTDTSTKSRNFKMPIYGLNGSSTPRDTAVAKTYSLLERNIDCGTLSSAAIPAITASSDFKRIDDELGWGTDITMRSATRSQINNQCTFEFRFDFDGSGKSYYAVATYAMAASENDKTATITNISVS